MLHSYPTDIALAIYVQKSVLVQILSLGDFGCPKLDVKPFREKSRGPDADESLENIRCDFTR